MGSHNSDFPKQRCKGELWILPANVLSISVSFSVLSFLYQVWTSYLSMVLCPKIMGKLLRSLGDNLLGKYKDIWKILDQNNS